MIHELNRRRFLASLGGGAALLPLLPHHGWAEDGGPPKRLLILQSTNGVLGEYWPDGGEHDFSLSFELSGLEPIREHVTILRGVDLQVMLNDPTHQSGVGGGHETFPFLLTGTRSKTVDNTMIANGESVDQFVHRTFRERDPSAPPLTLQLLGHFGGESKKHQRSMSYNGPAVGNDPNENPPTWDPYSIHEILFGASTGKGGAGDLEAARRVIRQKSMLDHVGSRLQAYGTHLGTEANARVQAHLEAIWELEQQLVAPAACVKGGVDLEPGVDVNATLNLPWLWKAHLDMIVMGMACDAVRAVTMGVGAHGFTMTMPFLGDDFTGPGDEYAQRGYHDIAHSAGLSPEHRMRKRTCDKWFIDQFAYVVERLRLVPEGEGTMLDNTVVLFTDHMDDGGAHGIRNIPMILAGGGDHFRHGRYVDLGGRAHNGVLASLCNAVGIDVETFGDDGYDGAFSELT